MGDDSKLFIQPDNEDNSIAELTKRLRTEEAGRREDKFYYSLIIIFLIAVFGIIMIDGRGEASVVIGLMALILSLTCARKNKQWWACEFPEQVFNWLKQLKGS